MKLRFEAPLILLAMSALLSVSVARPATEKHPASDEYHGVKVVDEDRWLEEAGAPAVKAWTEAQNGHARAYLDALPDRAEIELHTSRDGSKALADAEVVVPESDAVIEGVTPTASFLCDQLRMKPVRPEHVLPL